MDLYKVLSGLKKERLLIDQAIAHLERLDTGPHPISSRRLTRTDSPENRPERARAAEMGE